MLGFAGVTAIEARVAAVTVRVVLPEMEPEVAVIVLLPTATDCARPVAAPIVATPVVPEVQVTEVVISTVEASV